MVIVPPVNLIPSGLPGSASDGDEESFVGALPVPGAELGWDARWSRGTPNEDHV